MLPRQKGSILLCAQKENVRDPNTEHAEAEYQREQARTAAALALHDLFLWAELPSTNLPGCVALRSALEAAWRS